MSGLLNKLRHKNTTSSTGLNNSGEVYNTQSLNTSGGLVQQQPIVNQQQTLNTGLVQQQPILTQQQTFNQQQTLNTSGGLAQHHVTHSLAPIVQETVRQDRIVEVQPVLHRSIDKNIVHHVEKHIQEPAAPHMGGTFEKPAVVQQEIHTNVVNEIQPIIHRERVVPIVERSETHLTQHIVQPTIHTHEVIYEKFQHAEQAIEQRLHVGQYGNQQGLAGQNWQQQQGLVGQQGLQTGLAGQNWQQQQGLQTGLAGQQGLGLQKPIIAGQGLNQGLSSQPLSSQSGFNQGLSSQPLSSQSGLNQGFSSQPLSAQSGLANQSLNQNLSAQPLNQNLSGLNAQSGLANRGLSNQSTFQPGVDQSGFSSQQGLNQGLNKTFNNQGQSTSGFNQTLDPSLKQQPVNAWTEQGRQHTVAP